MFVCLFVVVVVYFVVVVCLLFLTHHLVNHVFSRISVLVHARQSEIDLHIQGHFR